MAAKSAKTVILKLNSTAAQFIQIENRVPTSKIFYNQAIIDHIIKSSKSGREVEVEITEI